MAMVNAKTTKRLIEMLIKQLGRQPTLKELSLAMQGVMPRKG